MEMHNASMLLTFVENHDVYVEINYQPYRQHYRIYAYDPDTEEILRTLSPYRSYESAWGDCRDMPPHKVVEDPYKVWREENPRHAWALGQMKDPEEFIPQIMQGTITSSEMGLLWEVANQLERENQECSLIALS
jgi:hypothetical protein